MSLKRTLTFLLKLQVLVIYLLFFGVQVFFNLDIPKNGRTFNHVNYISKGQAGQSHLTAQSTSHNPVKKKIRLNKRFQSPGLICILTHSPQVPIAYFEEQTTQLYAEGFYALNIDLTLALRGPPASV